MQSRVRASALEEEVARLHGQEGRQHAFAGVSREEVASRAAQEKAAATEAYLRWQDSKVSGPAAAADNNGGWGP